MAIGRTIGSCLSGGEVIELTSDLGGGKTTLTRGIAEGLKSADPVASPSFTICNTYACEDGLQLSHFDFYRLSEPGIVANELSEVLDDPANITVIEWPDIIEGILPPEHISIEIVSTESGERKIKIALPDSFSKLAERLEDHRG